MMVSRIYRIHWNHLLFHWSTSLMAHTFLALKLSTTLSQPHNLHLSLFGLPSISFLCAHAQRSPNAVACSCCFCFLTSCSLLITVERGFLVKHIHWNCSLNITKSMARFSHHLLDLSGIPKRWSLLPWNTRFPWLTWHQPFFIYLNHLWLFLFTFLCWFLLTAWPCKAGGPQSCFLALILL